MGSVLSVSNRGSATFADYSGTAKVFGALLRQYNKAAKTIASLWVFSSDLLLNVRVFLALSSS